MDDLLVGFNIASFRRVGVADSRDVFVVLRKPLAVCDSSCDDASLTAFRPILFRLCWSMCELVLPRIWLRVESRTVGAVVTVERV